MALGLGLSVATPIVAQQAAAELKPRYTALAVAVEKRDLAAIAAFYVSDATFELKTPTGKDRVRGADAIAGPWQSAIREGVVTFAVTGTDGKIDAGVISETGRFTMTRKDASVFARGTYAATWRKDNGVWKIVTHALVMDAH
jgi:ketosteroid isomerase-like protein